MAGLPYPPELPAPVSSVFTPAPRVRRSDLPGPLVSAPRERDFRGTDPVSFLLAPLAAQQFDDWYRFELSDGARLFSTLWPLPSGWKPDAVRKWTTPLQWERLSNGYFRVSGMTEVLGRYGEIFDGFDARRAGWPGYIEYAVRAGDLVTDVSVPWTWATPDLSWDDYYGWAGFIGYVHETSDLGAVRPTWVRVSASADQPITIERMASPNGFDWDTWVEVPNGFGLAPDRFDARFVRIRIRVPNNPTATLTAARVSIFQRD